MKCPSCGKIIPDTVKHCAYCGEEIPTARRAPRAPCGVQILSVSQLADHFYQHWEEGKDLLYDGTLATWFSGYFYDSHLEQKANELQRYQGKDEDAGLQELLDLCGVPGPTLEVSNPNLKGGTLDLGQIDKAGIVRVALTMRNRTRGCLHGEAVSQEAWLGISGDGTFACSPVQPQAQVTVELNTEAMHELTSPTPVLEVRSNDAQTPRLVLHLKVLFDPKLGITWDSGRGPQPPPIDFGELAKGDQQRITRSITLTNIGGRILQGTVHQHAWLNVSPAPFSFGPLAEGASTTLDIVADPNQLQIKRSQTECLPITTNMGDERVPARISLRKWWFATIVALPLALFYALLGLMSVWIVASFVVDLWWHGTALLSVVRSASREYLTHASLLGMTGAALYLMTPLIEEIEYYYFQDKFVARLPVPIIDRERTAFVTVVLTTSGLILGGVAANLNAQGVIAIPVNLLMITGAAGALGMLTTSRAYVWSTRQPMRTLRLMLLILAASVFYAVTAYVVSGGSDRWVNAWRGGVLGAVWGISVAGSESSFCPPIVRVRLRQIANAFLAITLTLLGSYGIDIFRSAVHPGSPIIPTHIHAPRGGYDLVQSAVGWFGAFVWAAISCCIGLLGLLTGLSAGVLADSDLHTSKLRRMALRAWRSLPLVDSFKTLWTSALGNGLTIPDFGVLRRLHTEEIRELIETFTHWPGTSEQNWAAQLVTRIALLLGGYLVLIGGISILMIPVMIVIGIVAAVIYVIIMVVVGIIALLVILWVLANL